jgi:hypothetical protein
MMVNPRNTLVELANEFLPETYDTWNAENTSTDWYAHDADMRLKHVLDYVSTLPDGPERRKLALFGAALVTHQVRRDDTHKTLVDLLETFSRELSEDVTAKDYTILVLRRYHEQSHVSERKVFQARGQNAYHAQAMLRENSEEFKKWFAECASFYQTEDADLDMTTFTGTVELATSY